MAITNNGTMVSLPAGQLPEGYVKPVVNSFNDQEYSRTLTLNVAKATVENADPAITLDNILDDIAIGVNKQITDILAADFLNTANVVAYGNLVELTTNQVSIAADSPVWTNAAAVYIAKVILHIKTA